MRVSDSALIEVCLARIGDYFIVGDSTMRLINHVALKAGDIVVHYTLKFRSDTALASGENYQHECVVKPGTMLKRVLGAAEQSVLIAAGL